MWTPIRLKSEPRVKGWRSKTGWYCYNTISLSTDPRKNYSAKQAAQKECDRRNESETTAADDGKLRNPRRWFTIGYVDRMATLLSDPSHYNGHLSNLLNETVETLQSGNIPSAHMAVIWSGKLTRDSALHDPNEHPIRHVYADGRITKPSIW